MDGSGSIDKEEMGHFLTVIMMLQRDLDFKQSNAFFKGEDRIVG